MIQRCFFYVPIIYLGCDVWNAHLKLSDPLQNAIAASCFTSTLVTPSVSCFEVLKLEQQLSRNLGQVKPMGQIFRHLYGTYGLTGIFPTLFTTFGRETFFAAGIVFISPAVHEYLKEEYNIDSIIAAGCSAGILTQMLTHPFDTIKTWQEKKKTGFFRSVKDIYRNEGGMFFMNGLTPRCARGCWTFTCLYYCTRKFSTIYTEKKKQWR